MDEDAFDRAKEFARNIFEGDSTGHDIYHTLRVHDLAVTICSEEGGEEDLLRRLPPEERPRQRNQNAYKAEDLEAYLASTRPEEANEERNRQQRQRRQRQRPAAGNADATHARRLARVHALRRVLRIAHAAAPHQTAQPEREEQHDGENQQGQRQHGRSTKEKGAAWYHRRRT